MITKSIRINKNTQVNPVPINQEIIPRPPIFLFGLAGHEHLIKAPRAASGSMLLVSTYGGTDTWQSHFTNNGINTIQDQINRGWPYYANPGSAAGASYEEVFNLGVLIKNSIIAANVSREPINQEVHVICKLATSTDNINWSAFTSATSIFGQSFQYIKIRLEFACDTITSLAIFRRLTVSISVKEAVDSGSIACYATDVKPGTKVYFTKTFKDVDSLTATVESPTEPYEVVISWVDAPNPTFFYIMVFDTSGGRVSKQVSWKARGVI
jgi:hypothetical protein